jgi:multicomponent Na+:H+ antiporter subunit G
MSVLRDGLTILAVSVGAFFFLAGAVGLLRFPDAPSRVHALTKADNLGLGLIAFGLLLQESALLPAVELIVIWLLALFAGAVAGQLIAAAAIRDEGGS